MIKEVLVIFKTHLDLGFTDYAENIKQKYIKEYIPAAVETAYRQRDTDCKFIWTTGSWLINEALKYDVANLERAIGDGLVKWHALPFTTHTEYMNCELFEYGLQISKKLDKRFNKKTISAKMSDVPGHTIGIVPMLAKAGVELLHIGVNPATPIPDVPPVFTWKCGGCSLNVMYGKGYGGEYEFGETAVIFGVTGDNMGPQSGESLKKLYDELHDKYPKADVFAATLDDVALRMRGIQFPVIESEIGDSWIHGVASDPVKTMGFRELLRKNKNLCDYDLDNSLLLVPEHTWGMDLKTFFHNDKDWLLKDFEKARDRVRIEKSWEEQRGYIKKASAVLNTDISDEARAERPDVSGMEEYIGLPSVSISYQLFTNKDCDRYYREYLQADEDWVLWDFLKPGLPDYDGGIFEAEVKKAWKSDYKKVFYLEFEEDIKRFSGLPAFWISEENNNIEISWFEKKTNRLPEAFWVKFDGMEENWKLLKMGQWIDPKNCVGAKNLHAVWAVKNPKFEIENKDAPLAAPFGRNLLRWENKCDVQDLYFNLYNNIWNTNFPAWLSDDCKFRFSIKNR